MALRHLFAPISTSSTGATPLVPAVPNKQIAVVRYFLVAAGGVSVSFLDGTNAVTGSMPLAGAGNGLSDEVADTTARDALFATSPGNPLQLSLSSGVQVSGYLSYRLEG